MNIPRRILSLSIALTAFLLSFLSSPLQAAKVRWEPVDPADLAATECASTPGAKAEYIFIRERLDYSLLANVRQKKFDDPDKKNNASSRSFYQRVKVYTADETTIGGTLVISYDSESTIWGLAARVTKPDGSSSEYTRNDFKEAVAVKSREGKIKKLSAAFSGVSTGDVIDIQYEVSMSTAANADIEGNCQQNIPVREYKVHVAGSQADYNILTFNLKGAEIQKVNSSEGILIVRNLVPYQEEPLSPPEKDIRGWYRLHFTDPALRLYSDKDIWLWYANHYSEEFKVESRPNNALKAKAAELTQGLNTPEEKLARLNDYIRGEINNLDYFKNAELAAIERKIEKKDNWYIEDTFTNRAGYSYHLTLAFGALARAAGFEVRFGHIASRNLSLMANNPKGYLFLRWAVILVKIGEQWKPYMAGSYFTPAGMLPVEHETAPYQRYEEDKVELAVVPSAPASDTQIIRKARFTLDLDGNLEGDVEVSFGGHAGAEMKRDWNAEKSEQIDLDYRKTLTQAIPSAEIGELNWTNLRGIKLPLSLKYHVRIPGYAELLGERLSFAPNYFAKGGKALFTDEVRVHPIYFNYAKVEIDDIEIVLPEGYVLDSPRSPANVTDPHKILTSTYKIGFKQKSRTLLYKRTSTLCENNIMGYKPELYSLIKRTSELVKHSDEHNFICKPAPVSAPSKSEPSASQTPDKQ